MLYCTTVLSNTITVIHQKMLYCTTVVLGLPLLRLILEYCTVLLYFCTSTTSDSLQYFSDSSYLAVHYPRPVLQHHIKLQFIELSRYIISDMSHIWICPIIWQIFYYILLYLHASTPVFCSGYYLIPACLFCSSSWLILQ